MKWTTNSGCFNPNIRGLLQFACVPRTVSWAATIVCRPCQRRSYPCSPRPEAAASRQGLWDRAHPEARWSAGCRWTTSTRGPGRRADRHRAFSPTGRAWTLLGIRVGERRWGVSGRRAPQGGRSWSGPLRWTAFLVSNGFRAPSGPWGAPLVEVDAAPVPNSATF